MDWKLKDNMVDGLFFRITFTGRRGGHNTFVQAGAETSDTVVKERSQRKFLKKNRKSTFVGEVKRFGFINNVLLTPKMFNHQLAS